MAGIKRIWKCSEERYLEVEQRREIQRWSKERASRSGGHLEVESIWKRNW